MKATVRKKSTCTICSREGHNIRSCKLFEITKNKAIDIYHKKLFHVMVFASAIPLEESKYEVDDELKQHIEKHKDDNNATINILKETPSWLKNLTDDCIRSLLHGYKIDPKIEKHKLFKILNIIFIREADKKWMKQIDSINMIPYIIHSSKNINYIEEATAEIFKYSDFIFNPDILYSEIHDISYREERLQTIYRQNKRLLRYLNDDMKKINKDIYNTQILIARYKDNLKDLTTTTDKIENRKTFLIKQINSIPNEFIKPLIEICSYETKINNSKLEDCSICYNEMKSQNLVKLNCDHYFCLQCILVIILDTYKNVEPKIHGICPLCRTNIKKISGNVDKIKLRLSNLLRHRKIDDDITDLIN